jgi:Rieske Fe-S protein
MKQNATNQQPLWRDEFSIDQAKDLYVTRRQLSKFLVLTSLGMFAGNVWILIRSWFKGKSSFQPQAVGMIDELAVGDVKLFSYPTAEDPCIMIRTGADNVVAFSQKCTHLSCAVYYAKEENRLECPCHEGYFSIDSGRVLQGPPPRPLPKVLVTERDGQIIATGLADQRESA